MNGVFMPVCFAKGKKTPGFPTGKILKRLIK